jgi:hypothetical protein
MGRQQGLNNDTTPREEIFIPQVAYLSNVAETARELRC